MPSQHTAPHSGAVSFEEILWEYQHTLPGVCYNIRMSTTHNNEETPRPEPVCPRCGCSDDAPNSHELCETCVEDMEGEFATGYEADEDPYWDQHAEG